jgi:formate C-acetyltransferase
MGKSVEQYNFYRAVSIVSEGVMILTRRYAEKCRELALSEKDPGRKKELEAMTEALSWCVANPCRNFHEALQTLFMYQTACALSPNLLGISLGVWTSTSEILRSL